MLGFRNQDLHWEGRGQDNWDTDFHGLHALDPQKAVLCPVSYFDSNFCRNSSTFGLLQPLWSSKGRN